MTAPQVTIAGIVSAVTSGVGIKLLLEVSEAMPYPREDCNWLASMAFDLVQRAANNTSRKGVRRPIGSYPSWQPGQPVPAKPAPPAGKD